MNKYFVSKDKKILGPLSEEEINAKLATNDLSESDTMFIEAKDAWEPIGNILRATKQGIEIEPGDSSKTPSIPQPTNTNNNEWHLLRGEAKYGPYTFIQMVKMLQNREIYEYDYVWSASVSKWSRVAELRDFSPERISSLVVKHKDVFYKRKFERISTSGDVLLHDNFKAWKGKNLIISEGGCCLKILNSMLQPGDDVYIHFRPNSGLPAFRVKGEIVSKKFDPNINDIEHPSEYGVRFTEINDKVQKEIKKFVNKTA